MTDNRATSLPRLFLIRHGDTDWTDSHQHTGLTDLPLNASGEAHALTLQSRLKNESFTQVFTSPLIRAKRTCELAGLSGGSEVDSDLLEWDYGNYEGRKSVDIHLENPNWNLFQDGAPGGESPEQVAARANRFIAKARSVQESGDIAAFSSGHIIRMIAACWLGLPPLAAQHFYTSTASLGILGYEHDRIHPVILLWNENG